MFLQQQYLHSISGLDFSVMAALYPDLLAHSIRVGILMQQIANVLQREYMHISCPSADNVNSIFFCGLLHDIGKIFIPQSILCKPAALTEQEYRIIQQHTRWSRMAFDSFASQMLVEKEQKEYILSAATYHHEAWNGSGYPYGIQGEAIPLIARICSFADVFDALTAERPYKRPWSPHEALEYINNRIGQQFDPYLGHALLKDTSWSILPVCSNDSTIICKQNQK